MARRDAVVLTVSAAAELAGMHPQTVRQYDRLGLVEAKRTRGGGRRYSLNDVERLLEIQRLSQEEGVNLAGIARILELRDRNDRLRRHNALLERRLAELRERLEQERFLRERVFAAGTDGDIVVLSRSTLRPHLRVAGEGPAAAENAALVLWRPPGGWIRPAEGVSPDEWRSPAEGRVPADAHQPAETRSPTDAHQPAGEGSNGAGRVHDAGRAQDTGRPHDDTLSR